MLVEVRANSVQSAVNAQLGGADVIELCSNIEIGGTTPSMASIELVQQRCVADISVLIRPRAGDYTYNDLEFELMKREVGYAKELGAKGVSFGLLSPTGRVDKDRIEELMEIAHPLVTTFNTAFDLCNDPFDAATDLARLGINRIITSGQRKTAMSGKLLIAQLNKVFGHHLQIIATGGITVQNVEEFVKYSKVPAIQISALTEIKTMYTGKSKLIDLNYKETSARNIYTIKTVLNNISNI